MRKGEAIGSRIGKELHRVIVVVAEVLRFENLSIRSGRNFPRRFLLFLLFARTKKEKKEGKRKKKKEKGTARKRRKLSILRICRFKVREIFCV